MYSKQRFLLFIQLILLISSPLISLSQRVDSNIVLVVTDSNLVRSDSIAVRDSIHRADSLRKVNSIISPDAVESKVHYKAKDSTRFDLSQQKLYLYGDAEVYYENISLKAAIIEVNLDSNLVFARGAPDSSGKMAGTPVFKDGDQEFNSTKMTYNFKTKKGKINEVITQEGEGYIHGRDVKKTEGDIIYIRDGKYTTCDLPAPHFSIASRKLKVIPGKKIITGPAVLVVEDVPTPLGVPFGIFPNSGDRASGIIIPAPGESTDQGFFLQNGGYYFGISDKIDLTLQGDVYSKGSYALTLSSQYKNRYRYNGNFNIRRSVRKTGVIKEDLSYSEINNFFIEWKHQQDPKARPNSNFGANVSAGSSSFFQNTLNTTTSQYLSNNFNSSIMYSKSFPGKPFSLSVAGRHSQSAVTKDVNITLPDATFNLQRVFLPGKFKNIGFNSALSARNELNVKDTELSFNNQEELSKEMNYGFSNAAKASTTVKLFKYFSLNPAVSSNQILYFETIRRGFDANDSLVTREVQETVVAANVIPSASMSTILYGLKQFRKGKIAAIRHKMTPAVNLTYVPENNAGLESFVDTTGTIQEYSIFEQGIFGSVTTREQQNIGFSLQNNIEMKVRTKSDTGEVIKKVKILENLAFSASYNALADSLKWSPVAINGWTNLSKNTSLNFGGSVNLYDLDTAGRPIDHFYWDRTHFLGRLTSGFVALGLNLSSALGGGKKSQNSQTPPSTPVYDRYIDFDVPWSLNINYKINYSKPAYEELFNQTLNFSGDINITDKWKFGFTSGYDFDAKDISYTSLSIYRDLHCWEMSMNWIPYGLRQSYTFTIKVKASVLQDLKLEKKNLPQ